MKHFPFILFVLTLLSCNNNVETEIKEVSALRASHIYNNDSVYSYMEKHKAVNKEISDSYFEKAKNEDDTNSEKAIYYLKRAITLNPNLNSYKELAILLEKAGKFKELLDLYNVIVNQVYIPTIDHKGTQKYLFGPPDENLFYECIASSILYSNYLSAEYLYQAKDMGFDVLRIKNKILDDSRFKMDTTSSKFKNMMLQFLSYDDIELTAKKPETFTNFLATINDTSFIFAIDEKKIQQFNYDDFNGINGEGEMQMSFDAIYVYYLKEKQENKEGWFRFNFNHLFNINPLTKAIVYAIDSSEVACPKEMRHIYHRLVTYDNTGNIIDSKIVAIQSGEVLETVHFNNGKFTIVESKRNWKNPYDKKNFDNYIVSTEKKNEMMYEILDDGKIKEITSLTSQ